MRPNEQDLIQSIFQNPGDKGSRANLLRLYQRRGLCFHTPSTTALGGYPLKAGEVEDLGFGPIPFEFFARGDRRPYSGTVFGEEGPPGGPQLWLQHWHLWVPALTKNQQKRWVNELSYWGRPPKQRRRPLDRHSYPVHDDPFFEQVDYRVLGKKRDSSRGLYRDLLRGPAFDNPALDDIYD